MTAFELSETPIDPAALRVRLARPEAGAFAVFEGWVRNEHRGREVRRLEYEVFPEMARTEGQAIVEEAAARFPGCEVLCVHRCGVAEVGELAVWIGATAGHRAAAFAACRLVIEEIKRRLPVWKKEHFAGAEPEWVDCTKEHNPALRREEFHSRQARLPEFGAAGQARLAAANVLVVGAGGLGCVAADTLAAAGVARLTVIDPGLVELSNLPRQSLYTAEDLGLAKAVAAEVRLRARNPFIAIEGVVGALQETNAQARIAGRTLVLDCTDQFAARFLLHDVCRALGVPLVQAAAIGWDGSVNTFGAAGATSGCLHCLWPGRSPGELAAAGDCNGGAVFGPAVNALGLMQATEAIKLLAGLPVASATQTLLVSWLDYSTLAVPRVAQPGCPVCDTAAGAARAAAASPVAEAGLFVSVAELERRGVAWQVLSLEVAPPSAALARRPVVAAAGMPWAELRAAAARRPTLVVCAHGVRSAAVVRELRAEGVATVFALAPEVFP